MKPSNTARRRFLSVASGAAVLGALPTVARATFQTRSTPRHVVMDNTHTLEKIDLAYAVGSQYVPNALLELNHFLRDHYSGHIGHMDPRLYDMMHQLRTALRARMPYEIISGYRSPQTNERLRTTRGGGVARHSLHMEGQAIDLRLPGVPLAELRDAALELKAGGVGYYPGSDFVHIDTGRVRTWHG
jgi:uncharacterized protein YcbK (DUF882 family)